MAYTPEATWIGYEIRAQVAKPFIKGRGLEIGAGQFPQRLPNGVECLYFDLHDAKSLAKKFKAEISYDVHPIGKLQNHFPNGADFLIAHQVLEHTADPIRTLIEWHQFVRNDGVVILSVPDKRYFVHDFDRPAASFEHLVLDYLMNRGEGSFESLEHIFSFCLGWSFVWSDKTKAEFIQHLLKETKRTGHDFHWHACDRSTWDQVIGTAGMLGSTTIQALKIIDPETKPFSTQGEVIYVYRLSRDNVPTIGDCFTDPRANLSILANKLRDALLALSIMDKSLIGPVASGAYKRHLQTDQEFCDQADRRRYEAAISLEIAALRDQLALKEKELTYLRTRLVHPTNDLSKSIRTDRERSVQYFYPSCGFNTPPNSVGADYSRAVTRSNQLFRTGILIQSQNGGYDAKVFYARNGKRHWVPDPFWAEQNGFTFPTDVRLVSDKYIAALQLANAAPHKWTAADWLKPPAAGRLLRELVTSRLIGSGIEFGAGDYPMPIPLLCEVRYADRVRSDEFATEYHSGESIDAVIPDLITGIEQMDGLPEESLDFVVACHVIEHTKVPLLAFEKVYSRLRKGGQFVLIVPDKQFTFDRDREITHLEHFILDYESPSASRDLEHYVEWYTKAFPCRTDQREEAARLALDRGADIHYHTWTFQSFAEMVEYSRKSIAPWSEIWSQPTPREGEEAIEFYFVLTK